MNLRMRTNSAGPAGIRLAGKVYPVPDDEAQELVDGGFAVAVDGAAVGRVERAIATSDPEHATGSAQRRGAAPHKRKGP